MKIVEFQDGHVAKWEHNWEIVGLTPEKTKELYELLKEYYDEEMHHKKYRYEYAYHELIKDYDQFRASIEELEAKEKFLVKRIESLESFINININKAGEVVPSSEQIELLNQQIQEQENTIRFLKRKIKELSQFFEIMEKQE